MKFKAKPWKTGTSHVVTIPSDYITNGDIDPAQEYLVEITPLKS